MVPVGVSKLGCTEIHFIESDVKVNGAYYRDTLLSLKLLPDIFQISQGGFFIFRQDGAPAHRARNNRRFPGVKGARLHSSNHERRLRGNWGTVPQSLRWGRPMLASPNMGNTL